MIPFSLTDVDYPFNLYCSPDWSAETLQRLLHILGMRHWKTSISINNKGVLSNKKKKSRQYNIHLLFIYTNLKLKFFL